MYTVPPPTRRNSALVFLGTRPCFIRSDDISPAKKLAQIFTNLYAKQLRYTPRHGWLCRDGNVWRPGRDEAMQFARAFCHAAAEQTRSPLLTSETLIAEVLRLSEFEPAMRMPLGDELAGERT